MKAFTFLVLPLVLLACASLDSEDDAGTVNTGQFTKTQVSAATLPQTEEVSTVGVFIDTFNCYLPEGCGARFQLRDQDMRPAVDLPDEQLEVGYPTQERPEKGRIVKISFTDARRTAVKSIESLSQLSHQEVAREFHKQVAEEYPCLAETGVLNGNVAYSWELVENTPILKFKLTDTDNPQEPQPFLEFSYDGNTGSLQSRDHIPDEDPCLRGWTL